MMEEANDDQPEIVTHEEVAQAEREASQGSAGVTSIPSPSPLPSFLSSPVVTSSYSQASKLTASPLPVSTKSSPLAPLSAVSSPVSSVPKHDAPGPMQTPFEASSAIAVASAGKVPPHVPSPVPQGAGVGLFGWISNNSLVNTVVQKTKSSMESVITTLDPGMREVIRSGGEIEIVVTSVKDNKVVPIREAFQQTFGRATVVGKESQATTAAQPVGFTAGLKGAEDRISTLRCSGELENNAPVVSVEGFIIELFPDRWYEMSCLVLTDPANRIELQTCSQPTLIPTQYVLSAQDRTPSDYPLRWSGLAVTIGQVIEEDQPHIGRADWHKALSGVSRRDSLYLAALSLAHMYKLRLPSSLAS